VPTKTTDSGVPVGYDPSQFPAFAVTVDVIVLTMFEGRPHVLLVRRGVTPFEGMWAIPGGFKRPTETLDEAAKRELLQETGVDGASLLTQFGAYGDPGRDPRLNVVTVAYLTVLREVGGVVAGADASAAVLVPVSEALSGKIELAFDHARILRDALEFVGLPGEDANTWVGESEAAEDFLFGMPVEREPTRALATVLFTDIVDSTEKAASVGDARWRELVTAYRERARAAFAEHHGREIDAAGDGFLATFDGPARAVECALEICRMVRDLDLEVRAGCHTGEVERAPDGIRGIAVHIGARVAALAGPGEVLVSQTVRDLTAGSGLVFAEAGEHELKGVPERWKLYRVDSRCLPKG
jgi:class 3 adenylate cyclase/ADP-ribose pyrophosphatase YjhB (NUDIX family)